MFTRNWYTIIKAAAYGAGISNLYFVDKGGTRRLLYEGNNDCTKSFAPIQMHSGINSKNGTHLYGAIASPSSYPTVHFGTGTTPPTVDDYALESIISSGATIVSETTNRQLTDDGVAFESVYTIENTGESDLTIGEIGLIARVYYKTSATASSSTVTSALILRETLAEPVTIPPGRQGRVRLAVEQKLPVCPTE